MDADHIDCSTCREPIRPGARKCTKCDSFQDWRRFLSVGTSALALIIALVSVTSALGPSIIRMFQGEQSDLAILYVASVGDELLLLASNRGTRPAVIHGVSPVSRPDFLDFDMKAKGRASHVLVNPGEVQAIPVAPRLVGLPDGVYAEFMQADTHDIYVHTTRFGGGKDTKTLRIPKEDLFPAVLEQKDFLQFKKSLEDDYVKSHPELLDKIDPEAIARLDSDFLDTLSPEVIAHLKRVYVGNQPRTLMQR